MPDESHVLTGAFNLKPEEAIKYFEQKGYNISFDWHEMKREAHTRAFTVAGVTQLDVLVDIRKAVEKAQNTGQSLESFKKELQPLLEKKGWWGKKTVERPDGSKKEVDLSAPWRLKTIYRTNMQTAYMAGRYKGMKDSARLLPYWQYVAVMDGRTRDAHRILNGKILRHDDPFWRSYYPPNGWGCRCRVVALSKVEVEKKGIKTSDGESMKNIIGPTVPDGWDYNPGETAWLPDKKDYPAWARDKVEKIADRAKTYDNQVNYVKNVDYSDDTEIFKTMESLEKKALSSDRESAIIVTRAGDVFRLDGDIDKVAAGIFEDDLRDAYVTHNHVVKSAAEYGFSSEDIELFESAGLRVLRLVDKDFVYQLSKDDDFVDDILTISADEMNHGHIEAAISAKDMGVGYKRWIKK
ncbi:MAG: phage minor head protein [Candidatus Riflebacteria bacterium]